MLLTLGLVLATLFAAALLISALVPGHVTIRLGAALNTLQLHTISILGTYPSFALLSWLALWRSPLGSPLWRWRWMQALLALGLIQAASLAWSPSPLLGIRHLVYFLPLPFAAHGFYRLTHERPETARRCLELLLIGSVIQAALVIVFRVLPSVELAFLQHPVAGLFVSPNTLEALFGEGRNNVLDPAKAGGLFVNGNIASTYLGMCAVASWYAARATGSKVLRAVALLDWTAVLFTGSKAGLMCALAIPLGLAFVAVVRAGRVNPSSLFAAALCLSFASVLVALPFRQELLAVVESYRYESVATLGSREELWGYAVQMIGQRPFTGLGFGGWERLFELQAFLTGKGVMPAHNSLFILWLQSGLFGLLTGVAFVAAVYAGLTRALRAPGLEQRHLAMGAAGAFSWYFVQGLGENFGLVGEAHMTPLVGVLLGYLCARHDGATVRDEHFTESMRGAAAPSALPAV